MSSKNKWMSKNEWVFGCLFIGTIAASYYMHSIGGWVFGIGTTFLGAGLIFWIDDKYGLV